MADKYVWSGATGAADGSSWTDAYTTIAAGITGAGGGSSGNSTVWVHTGASNTHSESITAADETWTCESHFLDGCTRIVGVDKDNSDAYTISSSANVTLTSTWDLIIQDNAAIYGLRFAISGTGYVRPTAAGNGGIFQDCYFDATSGTPPYYLSSSSNLPMDYVFTNCTFDSGSDDSYFYMSTPGWHEFINCSWISSGALRAMSGAYGARLICVGCDFSGITNASASIVYQSTAHHVELYGCILPTSGDIVASDPGGSQNRCYESDTASGNSSTRNEQFLYSYGTCHVDAAYRTGGATYDGTNQYSYVLTHGDADVKDHASYTSWNTGFIASGDTGSTTFTVYIANATADYDDTQIWLEVEYFGSASNTLKTIATDGETDPTVAIGSGTTQTDDTTSTWSPSKTYMQKLSVTATVNRAGSYRWRVGSRVTTDIYIDPKIEIT